MNCCDEFGDCRQGRDCPVRRQRAYPASLPPDLPVWPDRRAKPIWRQRLSAVASAAGYAAFTILAMGAAVLVSVMLAGPYTH